MSNETSNYQAEVAARLALPVVGPTDGDHTLLYSYYVEREGKKEVRTINQYHMNECYGGQTELEAFLQKRCTKFVLLGRLQCVRDEEGTATLVWEDQAAEDKLLAHREQGAKISRFFEYGTTWMDELRKCHQ
jgi:hypothetical protein